MAYTATELATPASWTITTYNPPGGTATVQMKQGTGYPATGANGATLYPKTAAPAATTNPSGYANSPDEFPAILYAPATTPAYAYSWRTWEEKAAATVPAGTFVVPITQTPLQPYP
jgi:hypothetical protein